jgi:hypothetical protein
MDLGVLKELFLTQDRMVAAKCEHTSNKPLNLPMPFDMGPVNATGFVLPALGGVVAALRAAPECRDVVCSPMHTCPAR